MAEAIEAATTWREPPFRTTAPISSQASDVVNDGGEDEEQIGGEVVLEDVAVRGGEDTPAAAMFGG